ncbi:MAG TPA: hypothetical protein DCZ94_09380 [Lentisphaeria bacterium]|nr:MAG: hypothetical protein A2X48_18265 [Lentisphaerae bacterium GWF2_49_21]HBC87152.1 hypothetical protein [Lentisphaeria bacterium]
MIKRQFIKRFRNLKKDDLHVDLHMHSTWTDGALSLREIAKTAKKMGLTMIAMTDHVRKNSTYCKDYEEEIGEVSKETGLEILTGFEAKVVSAKGELDLPPYCRRGRHLIIGSVHSVPMKGKTVHPKDISRDDLQDLELKYSLAIIKGGKADILGHAGGMTIGIYGGFSLVYLEKIIRTCGKGDTAFEINSRYHGSIIREIWELLSRYNPLVSFGSDAHSKSEIGNCIRMADSLI